MAGLEGTVNTPFGSVQKKTALMVGGVIVVLGGIVWYRNRNSGEVTPVEGEINPATGYPYGSAEDAAALAQQANYSSVSGSGGGGNTSTGSSDTYSPPTNNAEWVQQVLSYMQDNGIMSDVSALAGALGRYISGSYVSDTDVSLIEQAIAVKGQPPTAGAKGYPPALNRNTAATPAASPNNVTNVQNLRLTGSTATTLTFAWNYGTVKPDFQLVYKDNVPISNISGGTTSMTLKNLKKNTTYKFQVRGVKGNPGVMGPSAAATGKTKAK